MKLNVKAFALTGGLFWGTGLFFIAWWIMLFEGATGEPTIMARSTAATRSARWVASSASAGDCWTA